MASDEILTVSKIYKMDGEYAIKCPHCNEFFCVSEDDISEMRGEQYTGHYGCDGWVEVSYDAAYAGRAPEQ